MPLFTPVGGGIGPASITATTGSPNIDTTSRPGKTIYRFTGNGTITVGKAGTAEILVVGGGGAGGYGNSNNGPGGGGGGGGFLYDASALLKSGTLNVTVGGGGASSTSSNTIGGFSALDK